MKDKFINDKKKKDNLIAMKSPVGPTHRVRNYIIIYIYEDIDLKFERVLLFHFINLII